MRLLGSKKYKYAGMILVTVFLLVYAAVREVTYFSKVENFSTSADGGRFYTPSPIEYTLLENNTWLWPKRFSEARPLRDIDIPEFYRIVGQGYYELNKVSLYKRDLKKAKSWSILVNTGSIDQLKTYLQVNDDSKFIKLLRAEVPRKDLKCGLLDQEVAFRLAQVKESFVKQAAEYIKKCDKDSLIPYFLEMRIAMKANNKDMLKKILATLQVERNSNKRNYSASYASALAESIRLSVNHL